MKIAAAALVALAAAMAACSSESPPPREAPAAPAPVAPAGAKDAYPLKTCVVSGEELGSMGDPVVIQHEGVEVRFCCGNCVKEFRKDPAKYIAIIKAAQK